MSPAATPHICPASELSGAARWLSRTCTAQMYLRRHTCVGVAAVGLPFERLVMVERDGVGCTGLGHVERGAILYEAQAPSNPAQVLSPSPRLNAYLESRHPTCVIKHPDMITLPTHLRGMAKGKKARYACSLLLAPLVTCRRWGVSR